MSRPVGLFWPTTCSAHRCRPTRPASHERQQIVQAVEAVERRARDRIAAPQPLDDRGAKPLPDAVERGEEVGDDGDAPEAHLAPGQRVAHERRRHHHEEDEHADDPQHLARRLVGAVVEAAEDMDVGGEEEHRGADRVQVADQPAEVHIAADALDGIEGSIRARLVVHGQHDAGDDLRDQHEGQDAAERPPIVEVARRREVDGLRVDHPRDRQPRIHPLAEFRRGLVSRSVSRHGVLPPSADLDLGVGQETVDRHLEVARRRSLTDASGRVVVRTVAGAQPTAEVALAVA